MNSDERGGKLSPPRSVRPVPNFRQKDLDPLVASALEALPTGAEAAAACERIRERARARGSSKEELSLALALALALERRRAGAR